MKASIKVNTGEKAYNVLIEENLSFKVGELLLQLYTPRRVMLVSDDNVYKLYGERIKSSVEGAGFCVSEFIIQHGEESKNPRNLQSLWEKMAVCGLTRSDLVLAVGGGVVGDLAGFAAATYQRGIDYISVPTSLLSMVDSSVGGKCAVDLEAGKNLAGAFHQPSMVVCDTKMLDTLPEHYYCDGMAEIIKYGMINRPKLLDMIENDNDIARIIYTCIDDKREIVEMDEHDYGVRQLLNFGHTVGHAVEKLSDYKVSHGFAVAAGMAVITKAAVKLSRCEVNIYDRLIRLLQKYRLPFGCKYSAHELSQAALSDKKRDGDEISLILPVFGGKCEIERIKTSFLQEIILKGLE